MVSPKTHAELMVAEGDMKALLRSLGPGCTYNKRVEHEYRTNPENGRNQARDRTCRSVTGCDDPAQNVPDSCSDWGDWYNID